MPAPIDTDNRGKDGYDDDYGDDVMNALTNIRNGAAQGESAENHGADPKNPAKNIERQITGVRHLRGAGDGWAERPNDRNEAGEDDGSSTIFLVEVMGPLKVASPEEERIRSEEHTSELQSHSDLVCRLLLEKKNKKKKNRKIQK